MRIFDEADGRLVHALRIRGDSFRPKLFETGGGYSIEVGEPETENLKRIEHVEPTANADRTIEVSFRVTV